MRDLVFFDKKTDYEDYLFDEIFIPEITDCTFYANLIQFIVDNRSPIFYNISDPSEHFAFSGAYHFETRRERYPNKVRENLFWLHDFTHLLFPYSHDLWTTSEEWFTEQFIRQERAASNETEVFAYYRIPGLREQIFEDETLYYDVLVAKGQTEKPAAIPFLEHRYKLVENDEFGERELFDHPEILRFFRQWRRLTPKFVNQRYRSMAGIRVPTFPWTRLSIDGYEEAISNYTSTATQDDYERNIIRNLQMAYAILGWDDPPQRWRHAPEAIESLEGAVFFKGRPEHGG